jgi:phage terminase small subunit
MLTTAQERFTEEYLASPANAAEAARRAGYSTRRAKVTACELLKRPAVKARIEQGQAAIRAQRAVDREELTAKLLAVCTAPRATALETVRAVRELGLLHGLYPCRCKRA